VIGKLSSRVGISGYGMYVPERVVTNEDLSRLLDTTDDWIWTRTGIRERRIAAPGETCSDLALAAARRTLANAGRDPADVDLVIVATATPDMSFPSTAQLVQHRLGAVGAAAFDLSCACTGFVYAVSFAATMLHGGSARSALIIGAERLSSMLDWSDRATSVLFGDGAGALLLERDVLSSEALFAFEIGSEGSMGAELSVGAAPPGAGALDGLPLAERTVKMNGREVFRFASRIIVESVGRIFELTGLEPDEIDWYAPHQANQRIIDHAVARTGIPPERVLSNLDRYGNTSAASIPIVLCEAAEQGKLRAGQRVLLVGYGAGLAWGSCVMEWGSDDGGGGGSA
jgi:3-oxoacyl-[acyl-carrier-protein] synthase-3